MHLYSLDLSENNVRCDSFEQLLPLARQLQAHADWVAMGGNDLPDYDKTTSTSSAALDELRGSGHFSLALLTDSPKGAHAEAWKETAEEFDIWSYGSPRCASAALCYLCTAPAKLPVH